MKLIKELLKVYAVFVAIFFIGRVFFYLIYFDRLSDISLNESLLTFIFGLRMDTIVISIILVIPAIFLTLTPKIFSKFISKFLYFYILLFIVIALFIESASFPFFAQYDLKPNYLFIEYLEYPKEVTSLLFKDYKLEFIFASILIFLVSKIYLKLNFINFNKVFEQSYLSRALLLLPILLLLFLGIRSSFGHRPVNISDALYSSNRVINEITKNSLHSLGYAYYSNIKSESDISKYGKMDTNEAYSLASQALGIEFKDKNRPFYREVKTKLETKKQKNLVIFIQESMGAQFTGFAGDQNLTPNLDKLAYENISFTNLYSNGTRSVRGLAALSSGTLPIAGNEVLKRNKSQKDYFTIATLLKPFDYNEFLNAAQKARNHFEINCVQNAENQQNKKNSDFIFVKSEYRQIKINFSEILYIEGLKDYVKIYTSSHPRPILTLMSLKKLEEELPSEQFMRVHRSYIISLEKIEAIERNHVVIKDGFITIAPNYKDILMEYIKGKSI